MGRGDVDSLQDYLDDITRCLGTGDWEGYRARIELPLSLVSSDRTTIIADDRAAKDLFDRLHAEFAEEKGIHVHRLLREETSLEPDFVSVIYETTMSVGGNPMGEPFLAMVICRRRDGRWRGSLITTKMASVDWRDRVNDRDPEFLTRLAAEPVVAR